MSDIPESVRKSLKKLSKLISEKDNEDSQIIQQFRRTERDISNAFQAADKRNEKEMSKSALWRKKRDKTGHACAKLGTEVAILEHQLREEQERNQILWKVVRAFTEVEPDIGSVKRERMSSDDVDEGQCKQIAAHAKRRKVVESPASNSSSRCSTPEANKPTASGSGTGRTSAQDTGNGKGKGKEKFDGHEQ